MILRLRHFVALALSLLLVSLAGAAIAGPATSLVQQTQSDLFKALKASDDKKVESLFDKFIDYDAFAQASLGTEWGNRSASEKAEFSGLLKNLVRNAYKCNLKKIVDFDIQYTGEGPGKDGSTVVKTKANKSGNDPVEINFSLLDKGGWKVQDIETEGVSLVENNRGQFVKIIKKDGYPKLIQKMKDKLANNTCQS